MTPTEALLFALRLLTGGIFALMILGYALKTPGVTFTDLTGTGLILAGMLVHTFKA